jgi:hypothetical protein
MVFELVSRLRAALSDLYPTEADARRIASDAGINHRRIDFGGSAAAFWASVRCTVQQWTVAA